MARRPSVTIVGPGRLGSALARALFGAGYEIRELIVREKGVRPHRLAREIRSRIARISSARLDADVVWVCVPDDAITAVARALARRAIWKNKIVLHSSGALSSRELASLRSRGASAASAHFMMTFSSGAAVQLQNVAFALEGDGQAVNFARQVARNLDMLAFEIRAEDKVLYHVLGSFASPLVVALLREAEAIAEAAGITRAQARKIVGPILEQTIRNYRRQGPDAVFTGPIARGDLRTVARHMQALRAFPLAEKIYRDLAAVAIETLPVRRRKALREQVCASARRK